jgi:predicted phage-related endonuclease
MQTHELIQGSPEWLAYRAHHFNASDAPAMMGVSTYKTRTQLLHELHTGVAPEVDPATQRRFDDGHRFEALARPLACEIIGEDLYPVTGSEGKLSASFDGLTMLGDVAFEHKTLNDDLRAAFDQIDTIAPEHRDTAGGAELPLIYRIQMEQQCAVSGCEKVLFMASRWAADGTMLEERHCWYHPDGQLRAKILAGWDQFSADLAAYVPSVVEVKPVGRTPDNLPALRIEVTGAVTASNLSEYKTHALEVFKGINRELTTDQDFADAEKVVRWCGDVETRLAAAKEHALSQTASIDELFKAIDDISAEARRTRLELDKLVKARKELIREDIVADGRKALADHLAGLNERLGKPYMPSVQADFAGAVKGKRTIDSLRDAVSTTLANAKIEASATADRIQINLGTLRELAKDHAFLFADTASIVLKAPDDLTALVKSRIADHAAAEAQRLEAERARIRAEEQARIEREQRDAQAAEHRKREAEAAALEHARQQEAAAETARLLQEAAKVQAPPVSLVAANNATKAEIAAAAPQVSSTATLKLGEINARIAPLAITAAGLAELGFEPVGAEKAAKLYSMRDYPLIIAALRDRLAGLLAEAQQAA